MKADPSMVAECRENLRIVSEHLHGGLMRWVESGVLPGQFLQAVLRNDLREAVGRADAKSLAGLTGLVLWLHNYAPGLCWGSPERVAQWLAAHGTTDDGCPKSDPDCLGDNGDCHDACESDSRRPA